MTPPDDLLVQALMNLHRGAPQASSTPPTSPQPPVMPIRGMSDVPGAIASSPSETGRPPVSLEQAIMMLLFGSSQVPPMQPHPGMPYIPPPPREPYMPEQDPSSRFYRGPQ